MDVKLDCSLEVISRILEELGFVLTPEQSYISATRGTKFGKIHVYLKQTNQDQVFCEIHHDCLIHFLFLGVDYNIKPTTFFENELKEKLEKAGIRSNILNGRSWSTRKNKAYFRGFRL